MAQINLTAGTLAPPACYANDQERLEAYVAAMVATITGGVQWEASQTAPVDLGVYWLQLDSNNRPVHIRKYSTVDAKWIPVLEIPYVADTVGGTGDAITLTNTPTFGSSSAFLTGRKFVFVSPGTNTGAVTLAVDGLAAKSVTKNGGTALAAGDIQSGQVVEVVYNLVSNRFEMITPAAPYALTAANVRDLIDSDTCSVPNKGTSLTITHGLSEVPKFWFVKARCITGGNGYSVDEEADLRNFYTENASGIITEAFAVTADDSAFTIARNPGSGAGDGILYVANKTTPVASPLATPAANWNLVAYWL